MAGLQHIDLREIRHTGAYGERTAGIILILEVLPTAAATRLLGEGCDDRNAVAAVVWACNFGVGRAEQSDPGHIERARHMKQAGIDTDYKVTLVQSTRHIIKSGEDRERIRACLCEGFLSEAIRLVTEEEGTIAAFPQVSIKLEPVLDRPALDAHIGRRNQADHFAPVEIMIEPEAGGPEAGGRPQNQAGLTLLRRYSEVEGLLQFISQKVERVDRTRHDRHLGSPVGTEVHPALPGEEEIDHQVEWAKLAVEHRACHPGEKLLWEQRTERNSHAARLIVEACGLQHIYSGVVDKLVAVLGGGYGKLGIGELRLERGKQWLHIDEVPDAVREGDN